MADIALRGNRLTAAKGGRARLWHGGPHNTGRTNLLEQLGRVEGERSNPNRRAEISRVHGELNRGYAIGGIAKLGKKARRLLGRAGKKRSFKTHGRDVPTMAAKGGRARLWHGGSHNTGRTNLLEQLGRVEGERSNPNRRAEISRVHSELNRGYAKGGRAGFKHGTKPDWK